MRKAALDVLVSSGLQRTEQGALIMKVHDVFQAMDPDVISGMSPQEVAKLYTVQPGLVTFQCQQQQYMLQRASSNS